jgi:hypothetical protein
MGEVIEMTEMFGELEKERQQQELDRIKTIIRFQDILVRIDSTVRQDFLNGTNGAIVWVLSN